MTRALRVSLIVMSAIGLWGCGAPQHDAASSPPEAPPVSTASDDGPLAGSTWRLAEIRSTDEAGGPVRPGDPSAYTLRLGRDGTARLRLDCNRASGTWSARPEADGASGGFEFGPLAATMAVCPPGSLGERIRDAAAEVRSFRLAGGDLLWGLEDGDTYVWRRDAGAYEIDPDAALEAAILREVPDYRREVVDVEGGIGRARYVYGRIDLNEDGEDEVFVYLLGSMFCGTGGCDLMLFTHSDDGYHLVHDFPISRDPVIVAPERTAGWHDIVRLESGGGAPATFVRHTFDGEKYVEHDRVPAEGVVPEGARVLTGGVTFEDGIPLEPRD